MISESDVLRRNASLYLSENNVLQNKSDFKLQFRRPSIQICANDARINVIEGSYGHRNLTFPEKQ